MLGNGVSCDALKCRARMDGCLYAIKRNKRRIHGESDKRKQLSEVFALSAFADCKGIVDYYGAFIEDDRLYIQLELCDGHVGVDDVPLKMTERPKWAAELAAQIASALACMHARGVAHLDIKPDNILKAINHNVNQGGASEIVPTPVYKVGDLGLASRIGSKFQNIDGDNRYLSIDIMNIETMDSPQNIFAADVFALGLSIYHLLLKLPEPPREELNNIRECGALTSLPDNILPPGNKFRELLLDMVHPDPNIRPSALEVANRAREYVEGCNKSNTGGELENLQKKCITLENERDALQVELNALKARFASSQHQNQLHTRGFKGFRSNRLMGAASTSRASRPGAALEEDDIVGFN